MNVKFTAHDHRYVSIDTNKPINWTSVTTFIKQFAEPFDQEKVAKNCSKKKNSKWYGLEPKEIISIWEQEANRATEMGTLYHEQREEELLMCNTIKREGKDIPIIRPLVDGDAKISRDQRLAEGIYPEHIIYLKSAGICGQADRVEVVGDKINVYDYKTNKEIKTEGYSNWKGETKMLLGPVSHLEDCHINIYSLQLSVYMYMMLKHNHYLNPGKMEIHHIVFEKEGENDYGYPIIKTDEHGSPIVKEVVPYELKYLKKEVIDMIKYVKNRQKDEQSK